MRAKVEWERVTEGLERWLCWCECCAVLVGRVRRSGGAWKTDGAWGGWTGNSFSTLAGAKASVEKMLPFRCGESERRRALRYVP